ncbi:hypothetical protein EDM57_05055 [Brevibacillus gelatini]|uniref:Uncharacterized protein n=1 Tax=Brevibacillus gelatini TaxID=1655277 RepID=A0A3M8B7T3_9BACL|nr:hypothetical protein [Brevibacillus gelatini]RNB59511.1 hypothetical protein EDM57_05055 [Brevibacillus gelatini]
MKVILTVDLANGAVSIREHDIEDVQSFIEQCNKKQMVKLGYTIMTPNRELIYRHKGINSNQIKASEKYKIKIINNLRTRKDIVYNVNKRK